MPKNMAPRVEGIHARVRESTFIFPHPVHAFSFFPPLAES